MTAMELGAMGLGPHAAFIVGAYATAALIVAIMIAWVALDHRRQARALAELEARGVTRRSGQRTDEPRTGEPRTGEVTP
jgi:heme exporter protein D